MKAKRLKEIVNKLDDNIEVFVRNSKNPCGNIAELEQVELSTYGFMGKSLPCVILNTDNSEGYTLSEGPDFITTSGNK